MASLNTDKENDIDESIKNAVSQVSFLFTLMKCLFNHTHLLY